MDIEKLLKNFDYIHNQQSMYRWARQYMRQVMVLLQFQLHYVRDTGSFSWETLRISALTTLRITEWTMHKTLLSTLLICISLNMLICISF